jgi:transcriptional regulator with XRE-family HTH domain
MTKTIDKAVSNADFGRRVGVHYTFASRLRNGQRIPSVETISAIRAAFNLDAATTVAMMDAAAQGAPTFGEWLNSTLFVTD